MQEDTANFVHAIITRGLDLKARLDRGESPAFATEQATLERLLHNEMAESKQYTDLASELEIRYALACWLDEIFVGNSAWDALWNEHKVEVALFGTNERAWKFWEKAQRAATRSELDILEVYYLCVMLGFRGELRGEPDRLQAWVNVTRSQIEKNQESTWPQQPELEPPAKAPPLHGRELLRTMVVRGAFILFLLVPLAALMVVIQFRR